MSTSPLVLTNVTVHYASRRGSKPVDGLRDVSFAMESGTITGLVGANGAGKTTMLEICVGALLPSVGQVQWFGNVAYSNSVRMRIGFCPDVPALPSRLTAREALRMFGAFDGLSRHATDDRIDYLAERLRLQTVLDQRVELLSRGNAQRVGICQAILRPRDLLLCDESFAPLDPVAQIDLRALLREEAEQGTTVLVSSHQLDQVAKLVDDIMIMHDGRVVRHLGRATLRSRSVVTLRVSDLRPTALASLQATYVDAWVDDGVFRIPWPSDALDESARRALMEASGAAVIGLEACSLEDIFLHAISSTPERSE